MNHHRGVVLMLLGACLTVAGCDKEGEAPRGPGSGMGYDGASSEDMIPDEGNVVEDTDLEAISRRGVHLAHMQRALELADTRGLARAGNPNAVTILPLVSVDPGAHSGEVTYFRWMNRDVGEGRELEAARARRWISVPLLLRPDRVLENEQHDDPVESGTDAHRRINAILVAATAARAEYPTGRWSFHTFREDVKDGNKHLPQTRVFLLAVDQASPDLEIVVQDQRRKKPASVVATRVHHEPGKWSGPEIETALPQPGVIAVARVRARGVEGGHVTVRASDGSAWRVDPATGAISPLAGEAAEATEPG